MASDEYASIGDFLVDGETLDREDLPGNPGLLWLPYFGADESTAQAQRAVMRGTNGST
jgi:hypothetical protein